MKYLLLILILISFDSFSNDSCDKTEKYLELKFLVEDLYEQDYINCKHSAKSTAHWKSVADCLASGKSKDSFVCGRLVGRGELPSLEAELNHCKRLKPQTDIIKQRIAEQVQIEKISVYKT